MTISKPHAALLATPGMGHLTPVLELGKRLSVHHNFHVTIFTVTTNAPLPTPPQTPNPFNLILLPPVDISAVVDPNASIVTQLLAIMRLSIPNLRSKIAAMNTPPTLLIVDFFSTESLKIADEFEMLKYVYVPSNAWFVAMTLYVPTLHREAVNGHFVSENEPLTIPGCNPVRFDDVVNSLQDRLGELYVDSVRIGSEMLTADGVLVNTWQDLEGKTLGALRDNKSLCREIDFPVYPVGPLVRPPGPANSRSNIMSWLDLQPTESVLYVSFGSGGTLSSKQITELAWGLELSQQRFVWVLRAPMENGVVDYLSGANGCDEILDCLPAGFLTRTHNTGLVVPKWAPQIEILAHPSVGGFLSHCGWNSTLESIVNGVPLIAWPLYAEQNMNATMLVEEIGVAIRSRALPSKEVVMREEIEKMVRRVMEDKEGSSMRERVKELKKSGEKSLSKGGTSYESLSQVAMDCQLSLQSKKTIITNGF